MPVLKNLKDPSKSHKGGSGFFKIKWNTGRSGAFLKKKPFLGGGGNLDFPKIKKLKNLVLKNSFF